MKEKNCVVRVKKYIKAIEHNKDAIKAYINEVDKLSDKYIEFISSKKRKLCETEGSESNIPFAFTDISSKKIDKQKGVY